MKIYRNGQEFELTLNELADAAEEFLSLAKKKQEETEAKRCENRKLFREYAQQNSLHFQYPENVLMQVAVVDDEFGYNYLQMTPEKKKDHQLALLWAISTLPTQEKIALEFRYRDDLSYSELAAAMNVTLSKARNSCEKAISMLRRPCRLWAICLGYDSLVAQTPAPGEQGKRRRDEIRAELFTKIGYARYGFDYVGLRHLGLSLETQKLLMRLGIVNGSDIRKYLINHELIKLPGITAETLKDITDALRFISETSDFLNGIYP